MITGVLIDDTEANIAPHNFSPQIVSSLLGLKISSIACGGQHAAVLGEDGSVYTCTIIFHILY
jgi:alpha-tubulin suppressor-like RCC1 family protein